MSKVLINRNIILKRIKVMNFFSIYFLGMFYEMLGSIWGLVYFYLVIFFVLFWNDFLIERIIVREIIFNWVELRRIYVFF